MGGRTDATGVRGVAWVGATTAALLLGACGEGAGAPAGGGSAVGGSVVSTVNGEPITVAEIERIVQATGWTPRRALQRLQDQTLLAQEAHRLGYEDDAQVQATLERARVQVLLATEVEAVEATDEDIAKFYEHRKEQYVHGELRRTLHVLANLPKDANAEADAAARAFAETVVPRFRSAATPEEVLQWAKEQKPRPGADGRPPFRIVGEALPAVPVKGQFVQEFADAVFALEGVGAVAGPVKTEFGWHAIYLAEILPPQDRPLAEVRDELRKELSEFRRPEVAEQATRALVEVADVKFDKAGLASLGGVGR